MDPVTVQRICVKSSFENSMLTPHNLLSCATAVKSFSSSWSLYMLSMVNNWIVTVASANKSEGQDILNWESTPSYKPERNSVEIEIQLKNIGIKLTRIGSDYPTSESKFALRVFLTFLFYFSILVRRQKFTIRIHP